RSVTVPVACRNCCHIQPKKTPFFPPSARANRLGSFLLLPMFLAGGSGVVKVAQVLARGAAVAQVVMLPQMPNEGVGLSRARLDRDHFQRLKSPKRTFD